MKYLMMLTLGLFVLACSTPKERYDDQRMEARKEYRQSVDEAKTEYNEEESASNKARAKNMVDNSENVDVDVENEAIDLNN